jgi:hypothetical protein
MTGTARFVCSDPDAGDFEFTDVDAVLDALEAALLQPATPIFDGARQSWQPVGLHPEIRAAWEARLRYRPPSPDGLCLPDLPSVTAIVRSLPQDDVDEQARRREAYARMRSHLPAVVAHMTADDRSPRFATVALLWAVALLAVVGWLVVTFAARLSQLAAAAAGVVEKR